MQLRKVVAAGAMGLLMAGSTLAFAATLADYPAPFVQNGQINSVIVVGASAKPSDVVGAIDLAAGLASVGKESTLNVPSTSSSEVNGGIWLQKKGKVLSVGEALTGGGYTTLTDRYLPNLLAEGAAKEKDGTEVNYVQKLTLTNGAKVTFDDASGDLTEPKLYIDMPQGADVLNYELDFLGTYDVANKATNAKMTILGKQFTIGPSDASKMTLFGGGSEVSLQAGGDEKTVEVAGETHKFKMLSWTVDGSGNVNGATISIDGQSDTYDIGSYYTIPGSSQKFYLDSVTIEKTPSTSGGAGETATAKLFVGSNKIEIPVSDTATPETIKVNDKTFKDAKGVVVKDSNGKYQKLIINWIPNEDTRVMSGDKWTDPLFGAVAIDFDGLSTPMTDSSRDQISLSKASSTSATLKFENSYGTNYELTLDDLDGTSDAVWKVGSKPVHYKTTFAGNATTDVVPVNDYVMLSSGTAATEGDTYILQLTDIDVDDGTITLDDAKTGKEYKATFSSSNVVPIASGKYNVSSTQWATLTLGDDFKFVVANNSGTYGLIALNDGNEYTGADTTHEAVIYTKGGTEINLTVGLSSGAYTFSAQKELNPHVDGLSSESYTYKVTTSSNSIGDISVKWGSNSAYKVGDTDKYEWLSEIGTYGEYDTDSDDATLYVPNDAVEAKVALGSSDLNIATSNTQGGEITYNEAVPVTANIALLDSEVSSDIKASKNLILVGGPAVNSLVAELFASVYNLTPDENGKIYGAQLKQAGILQEGQALIQVFNDKFATGKTALVVAGYDAADTRYACSVLQNYAQHKDVLTGEKAVLTTQ